MTERRPKGPAANLRWGLADAVPHYTHAAWGARVTIVHDHPTLSESKTDGAGFLGALTLLRSHLAHNYTASDLLGDVGTRIAAGDLEEPTHLYRDNMITVIAQADAERTYVDVAAFLDPLPPSKESSC